MTDEAGVPIEGATVEVLERPWKRVSVLRPRAGEDVVTGPQARTRSDGTFALRLSRGALVDLRITADGFARTILPRHLAGERVDVSLAPGETLHVTARDASGRPLVDARVRFWRIDHELSGLSAHDYHDITTDTLGRAVFERLAPGTAKIAVFHDAAGESDWEEVTLDGQGETSLDVALPGGRTLAGLVVDARTRQPIANAVVGSSPTMRRTVRTDANGHFALHGWRGEPGQDRLHVVAPGFGSAQPYVYEEESLVIELSPGHRVTGRVVDAAGEPLEEARVIALAATYQTEGSISDSRQALSEPDGSFTVADIRADLPHTLVVLAEGHGRYLLDFDPTFASGETIDLGEIRVPVGRRLEGIALGPHGEPICRAAIRLVGANPDRDRLRLGLTSPVLGDNGALEHRRTDDLGRFRFSDLSPGEYSLTIRHRGMSLSRKVVVSAEEDTLDVEFVFDTPRSLTVRVEDPNGDAVADALVWISPMGSGFRQERTDSSGTFTIEDLAPTKTGIGVDPPEGYLPGEYRHVVPADQEEVFVLKPASFVSGRVVDESGRAVPEVAVAARSSFNDLQRAMTDDGGHFELALEAGKEVSVVLIGRDAGNRPSPWRGRADGLYAAPIDDVRVVARKIAFDRELTVRILDPDGQPIPGGRIFVTGPGVPRPGPVEADEQGIVHLSGLSDETLGVMAEVPLTFRNDPTVLSSDWIRIEPDGQMVDVAIRRGVLITGHVVGPAGEPVIGAWVQARSELNEVFGNRSGADGTFRFPVAPDAVYEVTASRSFEGQPYHAVLAGVRPSTADTLTLRMGSGALPPPPAAALGDGEGMSFGSIGLDVTEIGAEEED